MEIDYTDEMVLDNFICGIADKEIKSKVFTLKEEDCTTANVLRFVEAKELGRTCIVDVRQEGEAAHISGYKRSQIKDIKKVLLLQRRSSEDGLPRAVQTL